ncbi:hypothetical protein HC891_14155 [Candidatus Gracilibacteria bacterium]|nr:hypothetical protein [Candidatus Gracilibacteria bacterium]
MPGRAWRSGAGADSTNSAVQLTVPSAGLYRLTMAASEGSFQLLVDDNYLRKTVVSGSPADPADQVYYLATGTHIFRIIQDATANEEANWSVNFTRVGELDTLPSSEQADQLGGSLGGGAFVEEWVPLQLGTAAAVNIRIAPLGAASDTLTVELFNGATRVFTSTAVAGGEVFWATSSVAAGANALRVRAADGNSAPLAYTVTISPLASPPFTWSGTSYGSNSAQARIRMSFPQNGLYRFTLGATSGRYQLRLNQTSLQKIVTTAGADFTAYVPAGTHQLTIDQDSTTNTNWSVAVAATSSAADNLPYKRSGATLGGVANDFSEEWLPVQSTANTPINVKVAAEGGDADDTLRIELYSVGQATPIYTATKLFTNEVFWSNTQLISGTTWVRVVAAPTNTAPMSYSVELATIPNIPVTLSGVSLGAGLNSAVQVNAPEDGVYSVVVTITVGSGQVRIGDAPALTLANATTQGSNVTLRVPLKAGPHVLSFLQDSAQPQTEWQVALSQRSSAAVLAVTSISPADVTVGVTTTLTVSGSGFESGTSVEIVDSSDKVAPSSSVVVSDTQLLLTLPASTRACL